MSHGFGPTSAELHRRCEPEPKQWRPQCWPSRSTSAGSPLSAAPSRAWFPSPGEVLPRSVIGNWGYRCAQRADTPGFSRTGDARLPQVPSIPGTPPIGTERVLQPPGVSPRSAPEDHARMLAKAPNCRGSGPRERVSLSGDTRLEARHRGQFQHPMSIMVKHAITAASSPCAGDCSGGKRRSMT